MKRTIYLILGFIAILAVACNNQKKAVIENPYAGAWEEIYSKQISPDTTIERIQFPNQRVKLLTNKHYAFGTQTGVNEIGGGGGEYRFKGDIFISYPKYHSNSAVVGDSLIWKSKIEGDLWTISIVYKNDTLNVESTETWKRIKE